MRSLFVQDISWLGCLSAHLSQIDIGLKIAASITLIAINIITLIKNKKTK